MKKIEAEQRHNEKVTLRLREPSIEDGSRIYSLVRSSPPLDLNSSYCYFMLSSYFAGTSVVAEAADLIAGYISAFIVPERDDTLFVWQVAVDDRFRKHGAAMAMIMEILGRKRLASVNYIETTVTPSNTASKNFFSSVAVSCGAEISESVFIRENHFPAAGHEDEILLRIGPIKKSIKWR